MTDNFDVSAPKWFVDFEQQFISRQRQSDEKFALFLESIEDKIISISISIGAIKRELDQL